MWGAHWCHVARTTEPSMCSERCCGLMSNYFHHLLWSPYVIGQAIIFSTCGFFFFYLLFCACLISAVADWMSTILLHMVWPYCKFIMQVWNVLQAARWKCSTQKIAKNSPSGHHRTTLSGYIFTTKAHINNQKKNLLNSNVSPTCPHNMVNFGPLAAEIYWRVWGTPAHFNGVRVLAALLHSTLVVAVSQTLRCWTEGTTYIQQGGHHVGHWPTF